jgi:hypothetical protein
MDCCDGTCTSSCWLLQCPRAALVLCKCQQCYCPSPWPLKSVCLLELMLVGCVIESAGQSWFLQPLFICLDAGSIYAMR